MLESALPSAAKGMDKSSDRGLAHNIAATVLRWMRELDLLIDGATRQRLPDDAKARMVLRIALAQSLILETPAHAAIATALPLVQGGPRRLVHGVFSTILRRVEAGEATLPTAPRLPAETEARWLADWGDDIVAAASRAWVDSAPLDIQLKDEATAPDGLSLAPAHRRLPAGTDPTALAGFGEGRFWVQDVAASIPARLLGAGEHRSALDLCAAPGGKSMQLASQGWQVTALDNSQRRMKRLAQNLERTSLRADIVTADLLRWEPAAPVDAILLDAPCSATGIFRRHPDVLHLIGERQIADRAELQAAMLARTADWLKPGGSLVYAVCSLERAEGEERLAKFLAARSDFQIDPVSGDELPEGIAPLADGTVRTLPTMLADKGGCDGFFIARLRRAI